MSQKIQEEIKQRLEQRFKQGLRMPHLAVILIGHDSASEIYVSLKEKMCAKLGFKSTVHKLSENTSMQEAKKIIQHLNEDNSVDGILLQLPLPVHLNTRELLECIDPLKDVDCLTEKNIGKIVTGQAKIYPCTPSGIIEMLKHYKISLEGKNVAVIGRSLIVGTPLFHLLSKENATVTLFHSKSQNIKDQLKHYDIVCVAIGKAHQFKYSDFKPGACIIDVGISRGEHGLLGDVKLPYHDGDDTSYLSAASPVPGGVGLMTIAMLMKNTLLLTESKEI